MMRSLLSCDPPPPPPKSVRVVRFGDKGRPVLRVVDAEVEERRARFEEQRRAAERLQKHRIEAMIEGVAPLQRFLSLPMIHEG